MASAKFEIGLYFVDTTYPSDQSAEEWQAKSTSLKREIEQDCGLQLEEADIAPGFSFPAFKAFITEFWPFAAVPLAVFLSGDKIEKNIDAWKQLYDRLKRFLKRPMYLDRNGALVLAINAVLDKSPAPQSLTVEGYKVWSSMEGKVEYDATPIVGVEDPPPASRLGISVHIFQIAADDRRFKAYVEGGDAYVVELPQAAGGDR